MENNNDKIMNLFEGLRTKMTKRIEDKGLHAVVVNYKIHLVNMIEKLIEEYNSIDLDGIQSLVPYQKYIMLLHSRLTCMGENCESHKEWLINVLTECQFIIYCYNRDMAHLCRYEHVDTILDDESVKKLVLV